MFTLKKKKDKPFVILQLTDLQVIDPHQRCAPDRLREDEVKVWEDVDECAFNQVRQLVNMVKPDWIIHTGDQVYGEFDRKGTSFKKYVKLMESFKIPWSFVFGNHDGEITTTWKDKKYVAGRGHEWQCNYIKKHTKYCLFEQGKKELGYGNYYIKLKEENTTIWSFILLDTHGTRDFENAGINKYQMKWLKRMFCSLNKNEHKNKFLFYHIPNYEFKLAAEKYYGNEIFKISSDGSKNQRGDFGENKERICLFRNDDFWELLKQDGYIKSIFVGHDHVNDSSIEYEGIRLTYGVKVGTYDYHNQQGATKITIFIDGYDIEQILL